MKLSQEIDSLYHDWVTSLDERVVRHSFNELYKKLKKMTYGIIKSEFKKLKNERKDLFHDMIEKTIEATGKNMINNVDFFSSWYRQSLKNHLRNAIKHRNRFKRKSIITEADMNYGIEISEYETSIKNFYNQEQTNDKMELVNQCLEKDKDKELFFKRHAIGNSICELAILYNSTVDSIKSKLKRAKKRLQISINENLKNDTF